MSPKNPNVRVRFAPSPTGALHLGGARTSLFNFLFARHHGGKFIVRIEDTDRARSTEASEREIFESMAWMGMSSDEPVERQTERMDRYAAVAAEMLAAGTAYRCTCKVEEIQKEREAAEAKGGSYRYPGTCRESSGEAPAAGTYVIRLKVPATHAVEIEDLVRGKVTFSSDDLDDWILVRSDGTPTYNFTVVVDDSDMGITHVIRGDDHLSNTPKQILAYRAMGRPTPLFAHVSMILGADKTRLSKRHGATSVRQFRESGILASALLNYLARLGWSHGDQELFRLDEMIEHFDLDAVNSAAAVFNPEKLLWVNAQHLKELSDAALLAALQDFILFTNGGGRGSDGAFFDEPDFARRVAGSLKTRNRTLVELLTNARPYLASEVHYEDGLYDKFITTEKQALLGEVSGWLSARSDLSATGLEADFRGWCEQRGLKLGDVAQPVRVALTGAKTSPPIFQVIEVLGMQRTLDRLAAARKSREK